MKEIKDIEEKKMIMAYFFKRREEVSRNGLYLEWSTWWKEDFYPDGYNRSYRVHENHLVYPHSQKIKVTPVIAEEADSLLQKLFEDVCEMMNCYTADELKEMLKAYREDKFIILRKASARTGYHISYLRKRSTDHLLYLAKYQIYFFTEDKRYPTDKKGKFVSDSGTFDEMLQRVTIIKQRPKKRRVNQAITANKPLETIYP